MESAAENRKSDLEELRGVEMHSPQNDRADPERNRLRDGQIADSGLVAAISVVDGEDVAVVRARHRVEEHIDASVMNDRQRAAGDADRGEERPDLRRRDAKLHVLRETCVRKMRGRHAVEKISDLTVIHIKM